MPFPVWKRKPLEFGKRSDILRVRWGTFFALQQEWNALMYGGLPRARGEKRDELLKELAAIEEEMAFTQVSIQVMEAELNNCVPPLFVACGAPISVCDNVRSARSSQSKNPQTALWR